MDGSGVIGTQAAANRTIATGIAVANVLTLLSPCCELSQIDMASFKIRKQAGTSPENCGSSSAMKMAGETAGSMAWISNRLSGFYFPCGFFFSEIGSSSFCVPGSELHTAGQEYGKQGQNGERGQREES